MYIITLYQPIPRTGDCGEFGSIAVVRYDAAVLKVALRGQ